MSPLPPMTTIFMIYLSRESPANGTSWVGTVPEVVMICGSTQLCSGSVVRLIDRQQHGSALVLDQKHEKLCRFGIACIASNDVNVVRTFVEGLSR
jgi:hypothetical protein